MRVLVLGTGGREHALAWKLKSAPSTTEVYLHPGNGGTQALGFKDFGNIALKDSYALIEKAQIEGIELVVIGPEQLLADGLSDAFRKAGFLVSGPNAKTAQLETSKVFAKEFMDRAHIPTAAYQVVTSQVELEIELNSREKFPVVLKADGLAAGKGVLVSSSKDELVAFGKKVFDENIFNHEHPKIVIEEALSGREISYIGLCDGQSFLPLASATDYKRVGEGDTGLNTGGMGCISPSPFMTAELETKIQSLIITPFLEQLKKDSLDFRGTLFVGLMVGEDGIPKVLEFNTRFGDPETEVTLLRLESDLGILLKSVAQRTLDTCPQPLWSPQAAVYVVGAAEGYPSSPRKGDAISGWDTLGDEAQLFFAGAVSQNGTLHTAGGRVLGVGALADSLSEARKKAYQGLDKINWSGRFYRQDIGILN